MKRQYSKPSMLHSELLLSGLLVLGLTLALMIALPVSATSLLPINLQQLSTRASLIFYAEVIDNETRIDPQSGRIATFTEFRVINLIKGDASETHTIKQLGGYDKASGTRVYIHGVPTYQTGKQYVVFLPKESSLGFCSPLGLHQGSFSVTTSQHELVVSNGHNLSQQHTVNVAQQKLSSIQVPLAVRADKPSQSRLDDFLNTIRAYNTN